MNEQIIFDHDFILELLKCGISNRGFMEVLVDNVKTTFLPKDEVYTNLYNQMVAYYKKNNAVPTLGSLKTFFQKDREVLDLLGEMKDKEVDVEQMSSSLEEFVKQSSFIELYNVCAKEFNQGNKDKAYKLFSTGAEKLANLTLSTSGHSRIFKDFPSRNADRIIENSSGREIIPTGIDELDRLMNGGPETGEFFLTLGDSKAGKSFFLTHIGLTAARRGYPVAHFQLEGTRRQAENRYDSAWTGLTYYEVKNASIPESKFHAYEKIVDNIGKGEIFLIAPEKYNAMNMLDIRKEVKILKKKYGVKLVIIDYLDLTPPDGNHYKPSEERFKQTATARAMKELAMEENVLVHSATQSNSIPSENLNDPEFVISREHLAEDKGKIRPVDALISINATDEERKANICRLFAIAFREHDSGHIVKIMRNLKRSRFYDRKGTLENFYDL